MKKAMRFYSGLLAALLLLIVGCKKFDDYFHEDDLVVTGCQLADIHMPWVDEGNEPIITKGLFSYNALGQPVSALFQRGCGTGSNSSHFLFRYDVQHCLSDYIEACDYFFDNWHVYKYNNKGLIVQDSTYYWGLMDGKPPSESDFMDLTHSTLFSYDAECRMTCAISSYFILDENDVYQPFSDTTYYNYNSDGNLIRSGAAYDDKLNICRTNKIWMFINRDYSRNNYMKAASYNSKGLPLEFPVSYSNFPFSYADTGTIKFEYNCQDDNKY